MPPRPDPIRPDAEKRADALRQRFGRVSRVIGGRPRRRWGVARLVLIAGLIAAAALVAGPPV